MLPTRNRYHLNIKLSKWRREHFLGTYVWVFWATKNP